MTFTSGGVPTRAGSLSYKLDSEIAKRVSFGTKLEGTEIKGSGGSNPCPENGPKVYQSAFGSPLLPVPKPCPQKCS